MLAGLAVLVTAGLGADGPADGTIVRYGPTRTAAPVGSGAAQRLVSNEYATYNAGHDPAAVISGDWVVNSGSLFVQDGAYWTGVPDSCAPDRLSARCTNSNVFRVNSRRRFDGDIEITVALRLNRVLDDDACHDAGTCWHGVHVWLRFQNEENLYVASIARSDATVVIKRKVPCGGDNGGTYYPLTKYVPHPVTIGDWHRYSIGIHTGADGAVTIRLVDADGDPTAAVAVGVDRGGVNAHATPACRSPYRYPSTTYPPIGDGGLVGLRGDYADFSVRDILVSQHSAG